MGINIIINEIKSFYNKIYFKILYWFWFDSPIYINLNFWKMIKLYMKAYKVFIPPYIKKYKLTGDDSLGSDYFYLGVKTKNKWLHISCQPLGEKTKYGDYRFESVPYFTIVWKNKIRWVWGLEAPCWEEYFDREGKNIHYRINNDLYWETIMDYVYRKLTPYEAYNSSHWHRPIWHPEKTEVLVNIPITSFNIFRTKYKREIAEIIEKNKPGN